MDSPAIRRNIVMQGKGCIPFYFLINKPLTMNSRYSCNHTMYGTLFTPVVQFSWLVLVHIKRKAKIELLPFCHNTSKWKYLSQKNPLCPSLAADKQLELLCVHYYFWFGLGYLKRTSVQVRLDNPGVSFLLLYLFILPSINQKTKNNHQNL